MRQGVEVSLDKGKLVVEDMTEDVDIILVEHDTKKVLICNRDENGYLILKDHPTREYKEDTS